MMDTMDQESAVNPTVKKNGAGIGPVLGSIIIVILLVLGGVYYFTKGVDELQPDNEALSDEEAALLEQSDSTSLADIEADVNATNLSGLDAASADFNSELETQ